MRDSKIMRNRWRREGALPATKEIRRRTAAGRRSGCVRQQILGEGRGAWVGAGPSRRYAGDSAPGLLILWVTGWNRI